MRPPVKITFLVLFVVVFLAITVFLFLPNSPYLSVFSAYLPVIIGAQFLGGGPFGFLLAIFASFVGLMGFSQSEHADAYFLTIQMLTLWGAVFLLNVHQQRAKGDTQKLRDRRDEIGNQKKILVAEVGFYEQRQAELARRAEQRHRLSRAARELSSSLDPTEIQQKLLDLAAGLFPGRRVEISYGQAPDVVDQYVIQKHQSLLIPNNLVPGPPLIASPISAQNAVAGVLRVGGEPGPEYQRDDLRLLEILANLASLALDNGLLFKQIQEFALRDGLTGLLTHRAFQEELEGAILEASRFNQPLSVILTDVDHFKSVNDTYGHPAGDAVLQAFAHVLVRSAREVDVIGRYGGEEFVVLLLQTDHAEAVQIAERMRADIERQRFSEFSSPLTVTASFGVATFPTDATSAQQLIRQADQRLYAAKKNGRNQVRGHF